MADKLYVVAFRWVTSEGNIAQIEAAIDPFTNWVRLNVHTWLVKTNLSAEALYQKLKPLLIEDDSVLVMAADPLDYQGWAPKLLWDWLQGHFPK